MGFMICPEPLYVERHGIMTSAVMISSIISSQLSVEHHGIMTSAVMISYIISSKPSVERHGIITSAVMISYIISSKTKCGASWHYDIGCHAYWDVVREIDFPFIVLLPRHRHLAIRGFSGSITPLQVASRLRTECHMAAINVYSRQ